MKVICQHGSGSYRARSDLRSGCWPVDCESWVTRIQGAFGVGVVVGSVEIQHFTIGAERLKAMRKTFRDQITLVAIFAEQNSVMLQESR